MAACGEWAFYHIPSKRFKRWFCGSGTCPRTECRKKFFRARVRLISALIDEYELCRFFTLTLDRDFIPGGVDPWEYVHYPWSKFRKRMCRRFADFKFVAILESHKNKEYPHIHGFTNVWMAQKEWSQIWDSCHGGRVVWIEQVKGDEVSEYVSKQLDVAKYVGKENLEKAYKQKGKHRTLWRSEGLKAKFELTTSEEWIMIKERVFREDGELSDFYAKKGIWSYEQKECQGKDLETTRCPLPE